MTTADQGPMVDREPPGVDLSASGDPEVEVEVAAIEDIAETIWTTLFDLPLTRGEVGDFGASSTITACVQIDGAWTGAVLVKCSLDLAYLLTAAMFQADEEPGVEDVADAIGELTNMMAGNVKALLPQPCRISLPAVALGSGQHFSVNGTSLVAAVPFTCGGHPLTVRLLRELPDQAGEA